MENNQTTRPKPPDDLDGEALLEWHRICDELAAHSLLDAADRALLTIYVRTWATWRIVAAVIAQDGPVVLLPNNWPGKSKEYEVFIETTKLLEKLLTSLGLPPTIRIKLAQPVEADSDRIVF